MFEDRLVLSGKHLDQQVDHLSQMWKEMANNQFVPVQHVRSVVADSWKRCLLNKVNVETKQAPIPFNQNQLNEEMTANQKLIEIAKEVINQLYFWVGGTGFLITLCNSKGIILDIQENDLNLIERATKNNFVAGADWSEKAVGTNGIGTCLALERPVQIFSYEHYCIGWQDWTCSGAPIRDPFTGKILGVLDVSGDVEHVHAHNLGLVVATTKIIEEKLKEWQFKQINQNLYQTVIDSATNGLIIVDLQGKVVSINQSAIQIIGLTKNPNDLKDIPTLFEKWNESQLGRAVVEEDVLLAKKHVVVTCVAIEYGNLTAGTLIAIKEKQPARKWNVKGNDGLNFERKKSCHFSEIKTKSPHMMKALEIAKIAAENDAPVLLLGESGTGKEMFAQAIHAEQNRNGNFVPVNCGAIPKELIASELFGYTEGAFTGALKKGKKGKFQEAAGGTIFLDEIGEMPLDMQVYLLRVLQEKQIVQVGGEKPIPVTCRIIAATNKNLYQAIEDGLFREDLYYRLNVLTIEIPPLRNRNEDILFLTEQFLKDYDRDLFDIEPDVLRFLLNYPWPGNVRQLKNTVERFVYVSRGGKMTKDMLPPELAREFQNQHGQRSTEQPGEKFMIQKAIEETGHNYTEAAKMLGISRSTFYRKLKKYCL